MLVFPLTTICCVWNPIKENTRVELEFGAVIVYAPSKSDIVPVVVPLTTMLTPLNGSPVSSFIVPFTVMLLCSMLLLSFASFTAAGAEADEY